MAGLYIHIPFCKQVCRYCDFHFSVNRRRTNDMIKAISLEIALQKNYLKSYLLNTVYFGGGSPSLLEENHFCEIMDALKSNFLMPSWCEFTLEGNPDDFSHENLKMYKRIGINRLSIGIQSFSDDILTFLNRSHNAHTAQHSVELAHHVGFHNLSLDLMYSIPGQSHATWNKSLETAIQLHPKHISAYALTIEKKTVFGQWLSQNRISPVGEVDGSHQFELLVNMLNKGGYEHYEISNFCQPAFYSIHNSNYWKQLPYLGIGPSAHSFNGNSRQFNIKNNSLYIKSILQHKIPCKKEVLTLENQVNEYIFTSLRTMWGCDFEKIKEEYNIDMNKIYRKYLHDLEEMNLAFIKDNHLFLTVQGKLLADTIVSDLFIDAVV